MPRVKVAACARAGFNSEFYAAGVDMIGFLQRYIFCDKHLYDEGILGPHFRGFKWVFLVVLQRAFHEMSQINEISGIPWESNCLNVYNNKISKL